MGSWMGSKAGLDVIEKRFPCLESNPDFSVVQPLAYSLYHPLSYSGSDSVVK
jgi:hypothetical protein